MNCICLYRDPITLNMHKMENATYIATEVVLIKNIPLFTEFEKR